MVLLEQKKANIAPLIHLRAMRRRRGKEGIERKTQFSVTAVGGDDANNNQSGGSNACFFCAVFVLQRLRRLRTRAVFFVAAVGARNSTTTTLAWSLSGFFV